MGRHAYRACPRFPAFRLSSRPICHEENGMPIARVRGLNIAYQIIGEHGPWVALTPGGRRAHQEFVPLARKIAAEGYRVVLHDRRNTGASDILIDGEEPEESLWIDDLHEL